jgi:hypothetical protein
MKQNDFFQKKMKIFDFIFVSFVTFAQSSSAGSSGKRKINDESLTSND